MPRADPAGAAACVLAFVTTLRQAAQVAEPGPLPAGSRRVQSRAAPGSRSPLTYRLRAQVRRRPLHPPRSPTRRTVTQRERRADARWAPRGGVSGADRRGTGAGSEGRGGACGAHAPRGTDSAHSPGAAPSGPCATPEAPPPASLPAQRQGRKGVGGAGGCVASRCGGVRACCSWGRTRCLLRHGLGAATRASFLPSRVRAGVEGPDLPNGLSSSLLRSARLWIFSLCKRCPLKIPQSASCPLVILGVF